MKTRSLLSLEEDYDEGSISSEDEDYKERSVNRNLLIHQRCDELSQHLKEFEGEKESLLANFDLVSFALAEQPLAWGACVDD